MLGGRSFYKKDSFHSKLCTLRGASLKIYDAKNITDI